MVTCCQGGWFYECRHPTLQALQLSISPRHLSTIPIRIDREDAKKSWSEEEIKATDLKDRQVTLDTKPVGGGPLATFLFQHSSTLGDFGRFFCQKHQKVDHL